MGRLPYGALQWYAEIKLMLLGGNSDQLNALWFFTSYQAQFLQQKPVISGPWAPFFKYPPDIRYDYLSTAVALQAAINDD